MNCWMYNKNMLDIQKTQFTKEYSELFVEENNEISYETFYNEMKRMIWKSVYEEIREKLDEKTS